MCSLDCQLSVGFRLVFKCRLHSFVYGVIGHPFEFDGLGEIFGDQLHETEFYPDWRASYVRELTLTNG